MMTYMSIECSIFPSVVYLCNYMYGAVEKFQKLLSFYFSYDCIDKISIYFCDLCLLLCGWEL